MINMLRCDIKKVITYRSDPFKKYEQHDAISDNENIQPPVTVGSQLMPESGSST